MDIRYEHGDAASYESNWNQRHWKFGPSSFHASVKRTHGFAGLMVASIACCATLNIVKAINIFYLAWVPRCWSILHWWSGNEFVCSVTSLFAPIPEVKSGKSKGTRSLGNCHWQSHQDTWRCLWLEGVGHGGNSESLYGNAYLSWFSVKFTSLGGNLDSQSSRAVRSSCSLMESPSFLMWRYKRVSSANKLAWEDLHTAGRPLM